MKSNAPLIDPLDQRILEALQEDGRLSMRELGRQVGLSAPAVTERVRRLEESGVITGYGAQIAYRALGRSITAFIGVKGSGKDDPALINWARARDGVLECHSVTGDNSCILKVALSGVGDLEALLGEVIALGFTCDTAIVLSSALDGKALKLS